jgi:hypothetical protein
MKRFLSESSTRRLIMCATVLPRTFGVRRARHPCHVDDEAHEYCCGLDQKDREQELSVWRWPEWSGGTRHDGARVSNRRRVHKRQHRARAWDDRVRDEAEGLTVLALFACHAAVVRICLRARHGPRAARHPRLGGRLPSAARRQRRIRRERDDDQEEVHEFMAMCHSPIVRPAALCGQTHAARYFVSAFEASALNGVFSLIILAIAAGVVFAGS